MPQPLGHAQADPTSFEAWIGRVFKLHDGKESLGASRYLVGWFVPHKHPHLHDAFAGSTATWMTSTKEYTFAQWTRLSS